MDRNNCAVSGGCNYYSSRIPIIVRPATFRPVSADIVSIPSPPPPPPPPARSRRDLFRARRARAREVYYFPMLFQLSDRISYSGNAGERTHTPSLLSSRAFIITHKCIDHFRRVWSAAKARRELVGNLSVSISAGRAARSRSSSRSRSAVCTNESIKFFNNFQVALAPANEPAGGGDSCKLVDLGTKAGGGVIAPAQTSERDCALEAGARPVSFSADIFTPLPRGS